MWAAEATGVRRAAARDVGASTRKERQQFGKPIGSFQAVKHTLSTMKVLTRGRGDSRPVGARSSPADAVRASRWALDTSVTVAENAIQVHGGMGFTWEMGLHYYLRHILTLRELVSGLTRERVRDLPDFADLPELDGLPLRHAWDVFGRDDDLGTLNLIDEAAVLRGLAAAVDGRRFPLSLPLTEPDPPLFGRGAIRAGAGRSWTATPGTTGWTASGRSRPRSGTGSSTCAAASTASGPG